MGVYAGEEPEISRSVLVRAYERTHIDHHNARKFITIIIDINSKRTHGRKFITNRYEFKSTHARKFKTNRYVFKKHARTHVNSKLIDLVNS